MMNYLIMIMGCLIKIIVVCYWWSIIGDHQYAWLNNYLLVVTSDSSPIHLNISIRFYRMISSYLFADPFESIDLNMCMTGVVFLVQIDVFSTPKITAFGMDRQLHTLQGVWSVHSLRESLMTHWQWNSLIC